MNTKRDIIDSLRNKLKEKNADSTYTNQFLYQTIIEQAKWLALREASAGRIWVSTALFRPYTVRMIEVPLVDSCLPITTKCKIYRSAEKIPAMWHDNNGPMLKSISSVDGSTNYFYTTSTAYASRKKDPYRKKSNTKYCFFEDGYLWIPEYNPNFASLLGYWIDDTILHKQDCVDCNEKDCVRFLDTPFTAPQWIEAEMLSKALELLAGVTKRMPDDEQINKNPNTKG